MREVRAFMETSIPQRTDHEAELSGEAVYWHNQFLRAQEAARPLLVIGLLGMVLKVGTLWVVNLVKALALLPIAVSAFALYFYAIILEFMLWLRWLGVTMACTVLFCFSVFGFPRATEYAFILKAGQERALPHEFSFRHILSYFTAPKWEQPAAGTSSEP